MKKLFGILLVAAAVSGVAPAMAETLPPPKIAVIDLEALSRKSLVTQDLDKKVEAAKATRKQNSRYKYEALTEELRALTIDSANMSTEDRQKRQDSLEQRISQTAEEEKKAMAAIEARGQAAMDSLQPKLQSIIKRVSEGMSVDVVLEKQTYDQLVADKVAAPGANDITGLIATFLNTEVPTVDLPADGAAQP
ncbi:MAG: OmpH family outer membrane protein [Sphingomonadales bacterium]